MLDTHTKAKEAGEKFYFTGMPCKYGHVAPRQTSNRWCTECISAYRIKHATLIKERCAQWREKNPGVGKKQAQDWRDANPVRSRESAKSWRARNPQRVATNTRIRRHRKINATPSWLTDHHKWEMDFLEDVRRTLQATYGEPFHIDHIVPLKGEGVRGLHVPWNLRVIRASDNLQKGNSVEHLS